MSAAPALSGFDVAADELRRQELARLSDALVPRIEALRSMTHAGFRETVALMLERFGHTIITHAPELVTSKAGRKFVVACAPPSDPAATGTPALARLHDAVVAANAQRGFFITARSFTDAAEHYADSAPIDLVDGARLIKALNQSRKHVLLPQTYKAMCRQCGEIVEHRIDRDQDEARARSGGHMVPPTIARAMLLPPRPAASADANATTTPAPRPLSKREIRAHNHKVRARAIKQQRGRE
jgi:hypothetical protein